MTTVFSAMRVEITFSSGDQIIYSAEKVVFVKLCRNCKAEFKTDDPRKEYHSTECREGAKYRRWQLR